MTCTEFGAKYLARFPPAISVSPTTASLQREVEQLLAQLEPGELFCDPDFPPGYSALFSSPGQSDLNVKWLRPQVLL